MYKYLEYTCTNKVRTSSAVPDGSAVFGGALRHDFQTSDVLTEHVVVEAQTEARVVLVQRNRQDCHRLGRLRTGFDVRVVHGSYWTKI